MSADSFTLEIIGDMLRAAAAEMFLTYGRSAQSPIIYEVLDMGCGLTSAQGELIAEAEGVPGFVGCLGFAVREVLGKFPPTELQPGDVYVTNDPWGGGGTHLSDVVLVMPLFHAGELLAFAANKAHWTELGGMAPGSWTTDSSEIYQEGLQLPALRLYRAGQPQQDLLDILAANVRLPEMTLGDMHAGVAALRAGERAVAQVCARYGTEAFHEAIALQLERGETVARRRLAALPDGSWCAEAWLDDDGVGDEPQYVCVRVTIEGERFVADYSGCAPQASGPINTTRVGLQVSVREIFKALLDPHFPTNDGFFRPVEIICPSGTLFTAQRPAPVSTYWETGAYASELIWRALYPISRERLPVGHHLSICGTIVSGTNDEGRPWVLVEPQAGGWGAMHCRDGQSGLVPSGDGETFIMPVEVCEARYPLLVDQFAFHTAAEGGAGRWRGGFGLVRDYRVAAPQADLTASFGRFKFPPWGAAGGHDGSVNAIEIIPAGHEEPTLRTGRCARHRLRRGDVARLITAAGGGHGDPLQREPARVMADLREGYLSAERARAIYGVVSCGYAVDEAATAATRAALAQERGREA